MATLTQVVGATAQDPNVETTPVLDGSIRTGIMAVIQTGIALLTAFGLDLTAQQIGAIMAFSSAAIMVLFMVVDRVVANSPRP